MREEFEKAFPVPRFMSFDESESDYFISEEIIGDLQWENYYKFRGAWQAWQAATALQAERVRELEEETDRARSEKWHKGYPPSPWCHEWFIAKTFHRDRVVLTALPEEYAYDFKTADDTYIKKEMIVAWMQFPDSQYIAPSEQALSATAQGVGE